jgi:agmatinase
MIKARDIDRFGIHGVIEKLKKRVAGTKVYISVDIDVLDPAFAPATGTSEVGGWSTRELLTILDGLEGIEIVGADVGEWYHLDSLQSYAHPSQSKLVPFMTIRAKPQCWLLLR